MKLNFKDLKQQRFSVDAEPTDTVADVKAKISEEKGYVAGNVKLIWSGKILADTAEIGSYEIKPTDHIVCMVSKAKPAAPSTPASKVPPTPAPVAAQTPSAPLPAPAAASTTTSQPPATPSPGAAAGRPFNDPSSMTLGAERQAAISNMEAMGFDRAQCERAFRAAYFNADRAVEYLLNGIPENLEQAPPAQRGGASAPTPTPAQPSQTTTTATTASAGEDEPVNLFEAAAAAGGRGAGAEGTPSARAPASGAAPGAGGAAAAASAAGLDFLRENPTFLGLRQTLQQNPGMLEGVLQQLASSNPALAQQIQENPEAFMSLLMEGAGDEGDAMPPGAQAVSVTEAERDAIERLCRLGFERDLVIQAYFACDKNEELAANFLFENPEDEGQ